MAAFSILDLIALAWFALAWIGYGLFVERSPMGQRSLTHAMHAERIRWMEVMTTRDNRIVDTSIMAGLQQGTAFFASTSLLAIGGALALARAWDEASAIYQMVPFAAPVAKPLWEMKVFGLAIIFVYAFFKFAWAYRLFNYAAILMGATPNASEDRTAALAQARRAASMQTVAASHFNRGLRAFFFALGYLGWFLSPVVLIVTTTAVLVVLWRRQFDSAALAAAAGTPNPREDEAD